MQIALACQALPNIAVVHGSLTLPNHIKPSEALLSYLFYASSTLILYVYCLSLTYIYVSYYLLSFFKQR